MLTDKIGRFVYDDKYMEMYRPYFDQARKIENANVLIIGANDYCHADPSYEIWKDSWTGYFVEPNPYAHENLKKNRKGIYIPYAISSKNDVMTLYAMTEIAAKEYEKVGANGSCITSFDRKHLETRLLTNLANTTEKLGLENMIQELVVSCKTVQDIIFEYSIPKLNIIQVDVEGMEVEIVPQCLKLNANIVLWEHQHLLNVRKAELKYLAQSKGYQVQQLRFDTLAYKDIP